MLKHITIPFQITKVDEEQRRVWGVATSDALDSQGDVLDYDASKAAVADWMKVGNIREMHDAKKAVGKAFDYNANDAKKEITVGAYISRSADGENTWQKVKEGILTGFSVGGKVLNSKLDKIADKTINRITEWSMSELSLVDNPANPTAQIVMVKSKDGNSIDYVDAQALLKAVDEHLSKALPKNSVGLPVAWWVQKFQNEELTQEELRKYKVEHFAKMDKRDYTDKQRQNMADKGQALPDGSYPIANKSDLANAIKAYGRAKDKAKAKAHITSRAKALGATDMLPKSWGTKSEESEMKKSATVQKDFGGTATVVRLACELGWFLEGEIREGDSETVNAVQDALAALKQAAISELNEVGEDGDEGGITVIIEDAQKVADLCKARAEERKKLAKTGAAVADGDPRDINANTVAENTPTTPVKGGTPVQRKIYHKDGTYTIVTKNADGKVILDDETVEKLETYDGTKPETPKRAESTEASDKPEDEDGEEDQDAKAPAGDSTNDGGGDAPTDPKAAEPAGKTGDDPEAVDEDADDPSDSADGKPDAPTAAKPEDSDDAHKKGYGNRTSGNAGGDGSSGIPTNSGNQHGRRVADAATATDLQKSINALQKQVDSLTAAKESEMQKAVSELTDLVKKLSDKVAEQDETIQKFAKLPQPIKTQHPATEVIKGRENARVDGEAPSSRETGMTEDEIVRLIKRQDELLAHPNSGTPEERGEIFRKLWKVDVSKYRELIK